MESLIFVIILIVVIICSNSNLSLFNKASFKGKVGEMKVNKVLSSLPKDEYIVLNDLMFKDGAYTMQIDHIVVSVYGIFVIETKNYKGWIFGNTNKDYWTQNIGGKKYSLYNPIFQNNSHVSFLLRKFSILCGKDIFPVVVFLSASKLQLNGDGSSVLWLRNLRSYIRSFSQRVMTIEEGCNIVTLLQANNMVDRAERILHKKNVMSATYDREKKVSLGICPQCRGKLILRIGK